LMEMMQFQMLSPSELFAKVGRLWSGLNLSARATPSRFTVLPRPIV